MMSAFAGLVWSGAAAAECTVADFDTCIRSDPGALEKALLREVAEHPSAQRLGQLGEFYFAAPATFRNTTKARWYLQRAADAGNAAAMLSLGKLLTKSGGASANSARGVRYLEQAAASGLKGEAYFALGEYYQRAGDREKALTAFLEASKAGHAGARTLIASRGKGDAAFGSPQPDEPRRVADVASTLAGSKISLEGLIRVAYAAGFRTEAQLLPAVAIALAESALWTSARNWQPSRGFRPATDRIGVQGPANVWSADGRQVHSDRGLWQIATWAWSEFPDSVTDDPARAARAAFLLSNGGQSFSIWDTFTSGRAQKHFDRAVDGWPALRPLVRNFLTGNTAGGAAEVTADAR